MTTFEELFRAEGEQLKHDVGYRTEAFYLDIIENISLAMKRNKMKKRELAEAMNVSPGRVTNLLRGYNKNLEVRTIVQAAIALGVEPNDLCARRKTREMITRWKQFAPRGFQNAQVVKEKQNGAAEARDYGIRA